MGRSSTCVTLFSLCETCRVYIDLDMKASAPSCSPTLPPYLGLQLTKLQVREPPTRRVALVLAEAENEIQVVLVSVKTQTETQTAQVEIQTSPVSVQT